MLGLAARDVDISEILDGNVAAFEQCRPSGSQLTLADAQQMIVDTIERMERVTLGHLAIADALLDIARRQAGEQRPVRILEVASGNGWLLNHLAHRARRRGLEVELTGSDLNPDLVANTSDRFERDGVPATMRVADATDLSDMADGSFDAAVMSLALHHLPSSIVTAALKELDRVSGGGMAIVDIRRSPLSLLGLPPLALAAAPSGGRRFALHDTVATVRRSYTVPELRALLTDAGLRSGYRAGFLPVWHPQRMFISAIWPR